jgi:hypothetical protein
LEDVKPDTSKPNAKGGNAGSSFLK